MTDWAPDTLAERLMDFARRLGATFHGPELRLAGAKSAVSFALPIDQSTIRPYLSKEDRDSQENDALRANTMSSGIAATLANYLGYNGFKSKALDANRVYRDIGSGVGHNPLMPDISHRYLAARSGVGFFGLSGNILTKDHGAAVILGTCVTSAELTPTDPIPPEESY